MMNIDVISLLEREDVNARLFAPVTYEMEDSFPIKVAEDSTLYCKYIHSPNVKKAVVIFYGNGECAESYAESELVEEITQVCGWNCLIAEYRGYGMSTGKLNMINILGDVQKVLDAVIRAGNDQIVLYGRSMGGYSVIEGISCCAEVCGVIMESASSRLSGFIGRQSGLTDEELKAIDVFFNFREKIKGYHHPVLLIHGMKDEAVPFHHSDALQELFEAQATQVSRLATRGGHNNVLTLNPDAYLENVRNFLNRVDTISLLEREDLSRKAFFPSTYTMQNSYPILVDDDCTLHCKYISHPGVKRVVVMFYGNGECAESTAESSLVDEITYDGRWNCFIAEYRGYGMSTGKLNIVNILSDVRKVMEAVVREGNEKIVVFGRSLGGFSAIESLSCCPQVSGVIIESAYSCLSEFVAKRFLVTRTQMEGIDAFFNYREKVKDYHNPVLLIHALKDSIVPYRHCEALHELFKSQSERVVQFSAKGDHNTIFSRNPDKYPQYLRRFLRYVE